MNEAPSATVALAPLTQATGISPIRHQALTVSFVVPARSNRFWAIPILGFLAKYIILIPHLLTVGVLGLVVGLLQLFLWVPVLFTGKYPDWAFDLTIGYLRWSACVWSYFLGLTDTYPLFQMAESSASRVVYPVQVHIERQTSYTRFWAVPVLGLLVKWFILIPHFLILWVLGVIVGILHLVLWVPVLFAGQYPEWGHGLVSGYVRWNTRVAAYALGVTDQYPPFALEQT